MDTAQCKSVRWKFLGLLLVGFLAWRGWVLFVRPPLEIGPETTFVTGPLTADGRIDYPAALHQRLSEGIMPEDNAAVFIDRALGPGDIPLPLRSRYFEWIGIDPLPEKGNYLVTQWELIQRKAKESDESDKGESVRQFMHAGTHPWNASEFPIVAEWLELNARPLDVIEQATQRTQYYSPIVEDGFTTTDSAIQMAQRLREVVRILTIRAMFRIGADDTEGAWNDLLACHRLSQLLGHRPSTMTSSLLAVAFSAATTRGDEVLIAHGLTQRQAQTCLEDLDRLPPFGSLTDLVNEGDRMEALAVTSQTFPAIGLDVNTMLRKSNQISDQVVAAMKLPAPADRKQALAALDQEIKARIATGRRPLRQIANWIVNSRRTITHNVGDSLLSLKIPMYLQADAAQTKAQIRNDLARIGFALAAYRAENGKYPEVLDRLTPGYLHELPLDPYTEKRFVYTARDDAFLVYSVGPNLIDEDGRTHGIENADDISFQVPPLVDE